MTLILITLTFSMIVSRIVYNSLIRKYDLDNNMKTRPNSGLIAIVDLLTFPIAELYITGIDFYRNSYSTYHPDYGKTELESIKEILKKGDAGDVHDINKQFMYFKNLFHNESRLKTDDIMLNYITNKKIEGKTLQFIKMISTKLGGNASN